jgi:hypothetical protein
MKITEKGRGLAEILVHTVFWSPCPEILACKEFPVRTDEFLQIFRLKSYPQSV